MRCNRETPGRRRLDKNGLVGDLPSLPIKHANPSRAIHASLLQAFGHKGLELKTVKVEAGSC